MGTTKQSSITIIGAGLAGSFLAILLAKKGMNVTIYEHFSRNEIDNNASKRSYTLTMYGYGIQVLHDTGLWKEVESLFTPLIGSVTQVKPNTKPIIVRLGSKLPFYCVSRADLLKALIHYAEKQPNISFHFETTLVAVDKRKKTIIVYNKKQKTHQTISSDVLFGADGINSTVRLFLQQGQHTSHIQEVEPWAYKQIIIPKASAEKLKISNDFSHAWTRKNAIFVAYPNGDGSLSSMLLLPKKDKLGFPSLTTSGAVKDFLSKEFPEFLEGYPEIIQPILDNPEGWLGTIYTTPWYYKDFMAILGDAAHGFLPFYGQGVSAAFGDCFTITSLIDIYGNDWGSILEKFEKARKQHTDALANLSKESFVQYRRSKKADYHAIYNKVDSILAKALPSVFHPPAFTHIARDQAHAAFYFQKHQKQRKIAKWLGIPIIIYSMRGLVALYENMNLLLQNHRKSD